jgi:polycomb protein EED
VGIVLAFRRPDDGRQRWWCCAEDKELVMRSMTWDPLSATRVFPTKYVQCTVLSTTRAHPNYVDCVRWLGDLLLTKSVDNVVLLWKPEDEPKQPKDAIRIVAVRAARRRGAGCRKNVPCSPPSGALSAPPDRQRAERELGRPHQEYALEDADIWFIRFSLNFQRTMLAVGNRLGKVTVWRLDSLPPTRVARLKHPTSRLPIRQTAFSLDGKTLLCCCEDGSVLRWDEDSEESAAHPEVRPRPNTSTE